MDPQHPLAAFCVASTLYVHYKHTEKRQHGFDNLADTGTPVLRDWLVARTFPTRASCAKNFLLEVENFLDSNMAWMNDKYGEGKMPYSVRELWQTVLLGKVDELGNVCLLPMQSRDFANCLSKAIQPAWNIFSPSVRKIGT